MLYRNKSAGALALFILAISSVRSSAQTGTATPGSVAMLVAAPADEITPAIASALRDPNPLVRATAARVANVRNLVALLPQLREALRSEENRETAREEVRAVGVAGGTGEIELLLDQSKRFHGALDTVAVVAIARANGPESIDLYLNALRDRGFTGTQVARFLLSALWGNASLATVTASRALGVSDAAAWRGMLSVLDGPTYLDANLAAVGLTSKSNAIATDTAWYLASILAGKKAAKPETIAAALDEALRTQDETTFIELALGRELLARSLGRPAQSREEWVRQLMSGNGAWRMHGRFDTRFDAGMTLARGSMGSTPCVPGTLSELLTGAERPLVCKKEVKPALYKPPPNLIDVAPPPFTLLRDLPKGVAAEVVAATGCRSDWIGNVEATVDHAGRVTKLDLAGVDTSRECRGALEILLRLGVAENKSIHSAMTTRGIIVAKSKKADLCIDEPDLGNPLQSGESGGATLSVGGAIKAPKNIRRVEPEFSAAARRAVGPNRTMLVIIESRIDETGCVTDQRVLVGAPVGDINRSALLALSQWKFEPGTLDGKPVPVRYNVTMTFRTR